MRAWHCSLTLISNYIRTWFCSWHKWLIQTSPSTTQAHHQDYSPVQPCGLKRLWELDGSQSAGYDVRLACPEDSASHLNVADLTKHTTGTKKTTCRLLLLLHWILWKLYNLSLEKDAKDVLPVLSQTLNVFTVCTCMIYMNCWLTHLHANLCVFLICFRLSTWQCHPVFRWCLICGQAWTCMWNTLKIKLHGDIAVALIKSTPVLLVTVAMVWNPEHTRPNVTHIPFILLNL